MIKLKNFINSLCIIYSNFNVDPSNFNTFLGFRSELKFIILNPNTILVRLKNIFLFLEKALLKKYRLIFISNISNEFLKKNFHFIVLNSGHLNYTSVPKLTLFKNKKVIVIGLFLNSELSFLLKKESAQLNFPVFLFQSLQSNNQNLEGSSCSFNLNSFELENIIINFFLILLSKNYYEQISFFKKKKKKNFKTKSF